ncbi:alpha-amylase family glycosyl hydrolase [Geobacter sulfurreducens]|uniref:alpha-amylase family glycosyl hydrolase n=1 Tax=Geobacter sulfurreducens TaxID=35554 RepID=UPI002CF9E52E|nr:alpha-amylase family glycosyl hydrolase [Geobacter sulfurreducens]HML77856.1 alpha-amylase family glycosyl hydrolase [Geobacter sulfurreducens]
MTGTKRRELYFPFELHMSGRAWQRLDLETAAKGLPPSGGRILFLRRIAERLDVASEAKGRQVSAGALNLYTLLLRALRGMVALYEEKGLPGALLSSLGAAGAVCGEDAVEAVERSFVGLFPPAAVLLGGESPDRFLDVAAYRDQRRCHVATELLLLRVASENRAIDTFRHLFDDGELAAVSPYRRVMESVEGTFGAFPHVPGLGLALPELLRAPLKAAPDSLTGQLSFVREHWGAFLPSELVEDLAIAFGILEEETRAHWGGAGPPQVLRFGPGAGAGAAGPDDHYPEPERFSPDVDWMPNVVLIAKMVYVWLGQLSRWYGREITRLDQVPDAELDKLAGWGVTGLWLIGIWERSSASRAIKHRSGNVDAIASAYSLFDYRIADDLGGWDALHDLKERALRRGIRLASDMVPNHTGIYSKWIVEHPDWFIQLDHPPYPTYRFTGPDLSGSPEVSVHIEDGYWDRTDAAVVFKMYDHRDGATRYVYHGNDGTSTPWNDTAQLDYLKPEVREAVIRTILHVAHNFPIIRFDAAMTLAKRHYQRLWFPQPGHSGVPSRAEHGMTRAAFDAAMPEEFWRQVVDRVAAEAPDTLLLAEAFWLMEGYFVRTLGMHRVYNSAFMNMLKMEENAKYRQTIKNVLAYDHRILQRFVNFMNNPDERTAVEQFGKEGKYFGAAVLLVTMPGLPMLGHGQVEGFHEKYGMEYRRAYWDEPVDEHLVSGHERWIFPLMRRRPLFSGSGNFVLYDFFVNGAVNEDVFAYSNRRGDDRALVVFHNRFAATSGWIRSSCAKVANPETGDTTPVQIDLGTALGFNDDGRHYYAFRDHAAGLDYLRNGRELCREGLFVCLEPYEFHVFLDFREIRDDDFETWGHLCHRLNGGGVPSIDEEVKLVRHGTLVARFIDLWDEPAVLDVLSSPGRVTAACRKVTAAFREKLMAFLTELARETGASGEAEAVADTIMARLALRVSPGAVRPGEMDEHGPGTCAATGGASLDQLIRGCLAVVGEAGRLAGAEGYRARSAEWFVALGLRRALAGILCAAGDSGGIEASRADWAVLLVEMLLDLGEERLDTPEELDSCLARLFADRGAARLLGVHRSGGVDWFVQELFETLVGWILSLAGRDAAVSKQPGGHAGTPAMRAREAARLTAMARTAGYRVDLMRAALLETTERNRPRSSKKPVSASKPRGNR